MNRRSFLASLAVASLHGRLVAASPKGRIDFVRSDTDPLKRVLVHEPGPETHKVLLLGGGDPFVPQDLMGEDAAEQHKAMVALLRKSGTEVLEFRDLLNEAIEEARSAGAFDDWLVEMAPHLQEHHGRIDADILLGADDDFVYHRDPFSGRLRPLAGPLKSLLYTRDLAVMTPRGVVFSYFPNSPRMFEGTSDAFSVPLVEDAP